MAAQCRGITSNKVHECRATETHQFDLEKSRNASNKCSVWPQVSLNAPSRQKVKVNSISSYSYNSTITKSKSADFLKGAKQIRKSLGRNIDEMRIQSSSYERVMKDTLLSKSADILHGSQRERSISYCSEIEVLAKGTKLMSDIKCPTVLTKIRDGQLMKSSVYYVLVEPKSAKFKGEIAALLFTDECPVDNVTTQRGELLPLVVRIMRTRSEEMSLKPMLLYNCYRDMFKQGSEFKLTVLKFGRQYVPVKSQLLKKLIIKDIKMMPEETLKLLRPLEISSEKVKFKGVKSTPNRKPLRVVTKLSELVPELRLHGLKARGGSRDFARWFEAIPPNVLVDVDFMCDKGIFKKDFFRTAEMLDRYLGLPRFV